MLKEQNDQHLENERTGVGETVLEQEIRVKL